jgi:hypothetical protein
MITATLIAGLDIIIAARRMNSGCIMAGRIISCANASWGIVASAPEARPLAQGPQPPATRSVAAGPNGFASAGDAMPDDDEGSEHQ